MKKKNLFIIGACSLVLIAAVVVTIILLGNKDCEHEWGEWTVVTEATCSVEGSQKHVCSKCNEEEVEAIAKVNHEFLEFVEDETSCLEDITKSAYCKFGCGEKSTVVIDSAPGHKYEMSGHTSLGCEHNEATVYTCTVCDDSYEVIENVATGHNVTLWTFKNETKKEGTTCSYVQTFSGRCNICNAPIEKEETVEKHEYSVKITKEATCSELGIKTYSCIHCDDEQQDEYENLDAHQFDSGIKNGNIITYTCLHSCGHSKTAIDAKEEIETTVAVEDLANNEVELKNASIALDESTLSNLLSSDVKLAADTLTADDRDALVNNLSEEQKAQLGDSTIFNFTMEADGSAITEFGGKVTVTIDYELEEGEDPNNIAIWYLMDDGTVEAIPAKYANGKVTFETSHFSYYSVTRLTQRERCALYGHVHNTISVEATCTTDGYDINVCRLCGDTSKSNIVFASGHNFTTETVNPTCTEHGKTTYSCSECNFNYTKVIGSTGHNWVEIENIPATTEAEGIIKYECSSCHKTRERLLPKLEAETELKPEDTEIIESIISDLLKHDYTIKLDNLELKNEYSESYSIKVAEGYITLNDDDIISGYFTGTLNYEDKEYNETASQTVNGYIENNVVYIKLLEKENGYIDEVEYYISNIDDFYAISETQGEMHVSSYMMITILRFVKEGILTEWYQNSFMQIVNKVENANAEGIQEIKNVLFNNLFKLTENNNGYELELRIDQLDEALTYLTSTSLYDLLALVLGEKTLTNLDTVLSFTVDKLIKELELKGIVLDDVIKCLDELVKVVIPNIDLPTDFAEIDSFEKLLQIISEDESFDLEAMLNDEEIRKISVASVIEMYTEMTEAEIKEMALQYLENFKEIKLTDMLFGFGGSNQNGPSNEEIETNPKTYDSSNEEEPSMEDYFIETAIALIQSLDETVNIKLNANKECIIENIYLSANVEKDQFVDFKELVPHFEMIDLICNLNLVPGNKSSYDMSYVKDEALEFTSIVTEEVFKEGLETVYEQGYNYDTRFDYVEDNGQGKFVKEYRYEREYTSTYTNEDNIVKDILVVSENLTFEFTYEDFIKAYNKNIYQLCGDWYAFSYDFQVKVQTKWEFYYVNVDSETGEYELVDEELQTITWESKSTNYATIYYNIVTKEFYHEYISCDRVEDKTLHIPAVGCEGVGCRFYVCAECGSSSKEYYTNGHEYYCDEESIIFHGEHNCDDGVTATLKCHNCDYCETITTYNHYEYIINTIYTAEEIGSECGGHIEYYKCLCGERVGISKYLECEFRETWKEDAYVLECIHCHFKYAYNYEHGVTQNDSCICFDKCTYYFGFEKNDYENANVIIEYVSNEYYEHNYVEDESRYIEAVGCDGVGQRVYTCDKCGEENIEEYYNDHQYTFDPNSIEFDNGYNCRDGVSGIKICTECGYQEDFYTWGHITFELVYDIQELGATCEGKIIVRVCPCGEYSYHDADFECDMHYEWNGNDIHYQCAVTDPQCLFEYVESEEIIGTGDYPCQVKYRDVYYYGTVDGDISTAKLVLYGSTWTRTEHDYEENYEEFENGYWEMDLCKCGTYYKYTYYENELGETIKRVEEYYSSIDNYKRIETYELITMSHDNEELSTMVRTKYEYYWLNSDLEIVSGYYRDYSYSLDDCTRTYTEYNYDGTFVTQMTEYEYCLFTKTDWYEHKCTGYHGYDEICLICGHAEEHLYGINGHSWWYDYDKGLYVCSYCGLENINGVNGDIIFEDSTSESDPDNIVIEYYAFDDLEFLINISIILNNVEDGENDQVAIEDVNYELNEENRYVSFSKTEVMELAAALGYEEGTYSIRLTFVPLNVDSDLDYSITLE